MFDKFGEFDSAEELNMAAEGLLKEGDTQSLLELAKENGIDTEDAQDYIDGCTDTFATISMAAYGRVEIEEKEELSKLKNPMEKMAMNVILTMLKGLCTQQEIAKAVMKKGYRVSGIFSAMRRTAERYKDGNIGLSCGTDRQLCEIIKSYYTETESQLYERIEALYKWEVRP